jgi:hypothetical protein
MKSDEFNKSAHKLYLGVILLDGGAIVPANSEKFNQRFSSLFQYSLFKWEDIG